MTTQEKIAEARHKIEQLLSTDGNIHAAPAPTGYKHRFAGEHHAGPDHVAAGRHASFVDAWRHADTHRGDATTLRDFLLHAANYLTARGDRDRGQVCAVLAWELIE